eukprot:TRINITY_DN18438_c5_g1_i1.p1 TRINITY_DN18438_c5_g1~~TRINITY_DN18438_c5_g1_i1.p1  ORF type:complete len:235 (-),score=60.71 TRINITY_DN18438_c5_g1_i1:154-858(-)
MEFQQPVFGELDANREQPKTDLTLCASILEEAAQIENEARVFDDYGRASEAIEPYKRALLRLQEALVACPEWHADRPALGNHVDQVRARIDYLEGLSGAPPLLPCERHIAPKQLTLRATQGTDGNRALGFAAFLGAAAGILASGPRLGILLAGGAMQMTMLEGRPGQFARSLALKGAEGFALARKRATRKLQKLQKIELRKHKDSMDAFLCHLGEIVFQARACLGAIADASKRQ